MFINFQTLNSKFKIQKSVDLFGAHFTPDGSFLSMLTLALALAFCVNSPRECWFWVCSWWCCVTLSSISGSDRVFSAFSTTSSCSSCSWGTCCFVSYAHLDVDVWASFCGVSFVLPFFFFSSLLLMMLQMFRSLSCSSSSYSELDWFIRWFSSAWPAFLLIWPWGFLVDGFSIFVGIYPAISLCFSIILTYSSFPVSSYSTAS